MNQKRELKETVIDLIDSVISEFRFIHSEVKTFELRAVLKEEVLYACRTIESHVIGEIRDRRNNLIWWFDNTVTTEKSAVNQLLDEFRKMNSILRENFEMLAVFINENPESDEERTLNMLLYSIGGDILHYIAGLNHILEELRKAFAGGE